MVDCRGKDNPDGAILVQTMHERDRFCMNGPEMPIGDVSPGRYFAGVAVVLGLLFASISVEEGDGSLIWLQWQLQTGTPILILLVVHRLLHQWSRFDALNPWLKLSVSGVLGASLFAPISLAIDAMLGEPWGVPLLTELWDEWQGVTPPVTMAWIAINAPWVLGFRLTRSQVGAPASTPDAGTPPADLSVPGPAGQTPASVTEPEGWSGVPASGPEEQSRANATQPLSLPKAVVDLLPAPLPGRLLFIRSELHYIHLQTTEGKALVLYSLRDVATALAGSGFQPHRSFWVAYDAIRSFERKGRQGELVLLGGARIPVSRRQLDAVGDLMGRLAPYREAS
jgi:hypothetical protein